MTEPIEILRWARDVELASKDNWVKGAAGMAEFPESPVCAMGAIRQASFTLQGNADLGFSTPYVGALMAIEEALPPEAERLTGDFNDAPDTTFSDVIDLFDRAIKSLEDA